MKKSITSADFSVSKTEIGQQSLIALSWVIDSIDETLQAAKASVRSAIAPAAFHEVTKSLHQVTGTLTMTELVDPLILAESLEQLSEAIASKRIALLYKEQLSHGIDALARELYVIHQSKRAQPLIIYRTVKTIRDILLSVNHVQAAAPDAAMPASEEESLSAITVATTQPRIDYSLFLAPDQIQAVFDENTRQTMIQAYRHLLNEYLLDHANPQTLQNMLKVAQRFATGADTIQYAALWRIVSTLHEAMLAGKIDSASADLKSCLIHLERMLSQDEFDDSLIFEMLSLFEAFQLDHELALHQQAISKAVDKNSVHSSMVLDKILLLVREAVAQYPQDQSMFEQLEIRRLLVEAVRLLELAGWHDIAHQLESMAAQLLKPLSAMLYQQIGTELREIETHLGKLIGAFGQLSTQSYELNEQLMLSQAHHAVLRETRALIESIKSGFFEYSALRQDAQQLQALPARFNELKGVFVLLGLNRPVQLLEKFIALIQQELINTEHVATRYQIDLIAQVIAALEYYLDQLAAHYQDERVLDGIDSILASFHQPEHSAYGTLELGEKLFHDNSSIDLLGAMEESAMVDPTSPSLQSDHIGHKAVAEIALVEDDFSQDDEIREIFIEEATEVLETLQEIFPQWMANPQQQDVMKDVRRAFHTLKGSGRMVGAKLSGELAWSVENMLNRVMDNTIQPDSVMFQLISKVLAIYPTLVENFASQQHTVIEVRPYMYVANLISKGEKLTQADLPWSQAATDISTDVAMDAAGDAVVAVELTDDDSALLSEADSLAAQAELQEGMAIFVEEAEEHLDTIHAFIVEHEDDEPVPDTLLRALHTLRGSAAMSNVDAIYRLSAALENEFKRLVRVHESYAEIHVSLLEGFVQHVGAHLEAIQQGSLEALSEDDLAFIAEVEELSGADSTEAHEPSSAGIVAHVLSLSLDDLLDAEFELEKRIVAHDAPAYINQLHAQSRQLQEAAQATPITALRQLSDGLASVYARLKEVAPVQINRTVIEHILDAHYALTDVFDALAASQTPVPNESVLIGLQDVLDQLVSVPVAQPDIPVLEAVVEVPEVAVVPEVPVLEVPVLAPVPSAAVAASSSSYVPDEHVDAELLEIFLEEAEELVDAIDLSFSAWQQNPSQVDHLKVLQRHLHTLKGGAFMAQVDSLGKFGHELETVYERLVAGSLKSSPVLVQFMRHAQDIVAEQVEHLSSKGKSFYAPQEFAALEAYIRSGDESVLTQSVAVQPVSAVPSVPVDDVAVSEDIAVVAEHIDAEPAVSFETLVEQAEIIVPTAPVTPAIPVPLAPVSEPAAIILQRKTETGSRVSYAKAIAWPQDALPEPDILSLFIEEAQEQIANSELLLQRWQKDSRDKRPLLELQRTLHTIRGGARMAVVPAVAAVAHELEFVYETFATSNKSASALSSEFILLCHAWLADAIDVLQNNLQPAIPDVLVQMLQRLQKDTSSLGTLPRFDEHTQEFKQDQAAQTLFETKTVVEVKGDGSEPPSMNGLFGEKVEQTTASNEMIRVSSSLMEKMINLTGENAINRARIEMGVNSLGYVLDDMGLTIQRLVEQLRRMEGELESQILARHEEEREQYADFDPLEMDQYSSLNQLSRSLSESASDLQDFKITLSEKVRDTENLLLQQSRIHSELQDGLMNSRLVPFSRMLPRLQRVVRQTATELGKPAELVVRNAEGELDRTILERIVAPLEHMLRNAVDHGLEVAEKRQEANKPAQGQISLSIERQGNEIILTLSDDGHGINVQAVREKAIQRGLISADTVLHDHEIMQFIFHAGLSTAQKVTQISGRGVGMDVVLSEIKQLGGTVSVDSHVGEGTTFIMRLPLTVAVADALMVRVGDRQFAVPLSQIERIVRVSPAALSEYYAGNKESLSIDGTEYNLRYLGEFIQNNPIPNLQAYSMSLPVLLVKSLGKPTAIQVDQLVGSRAEIVVKPAGQQLASIDIISGATIMGDGSVSIILDTQAMARQAAANVRPKSAQESKATATAVREVSRKPLVMVVDDSVTVRKVTTRLLERQGYDVVSAKDGVDAIEQLEEITPDIMLLDIEMPRMDGFEVATQVRHSDRLLNLPIIMITSRTGEKHRERAFLTGVNCYMGKPFQEQELLQNIEELLSTANSPL